MYRRDKLIEKQTSVSQQPHHLFLHTLYYHSDLVVVTILSHTCKRLFMA